MLRDSDIAASFGAVLGASVRISGRTSLTLFQESPMKKVLIALVAIALFSAVSFGCRASGDVDPHGSTSVGLAR